jgi:hypothetical protein
MGAILMKLTLVLAAGLVASFNFTTATATAAERTSWVGRDVGNRNVFWTCSNVGGNDWKLKKNDNVAGVYTGVTSTDDFVELQLKGSREFDRVRLYKTKLMMNKEGSRTEWIEIAAGKWSD